ncbi:type II secretion system F family protein, partial [Muricauda sp. JGD-17]
MGFKLENISKISSQQKGVSQDLQRTPLLERELFSFSKPFSNRKKEDFYTELGVLLKAGVTLKEALALIKEGQKKERHKSLVGLLEENLISGLSFSETIRERKEF